MTFTAIEESITNLISGSIESMGYELVRVQLSDGDNSTLQIMAERKSDGSLNVDDCTRISRAVSAILDVEDPIKEEYSLEVSSPGIDRPLVKLSDFARYASKDVKLRTRLAIDGRRRFTGVVTGISSDNEVIMQTSEGEALIPHDNIESAKLVLTDELMKEAISNSN